VDHGEHSQPSRRLSAFHVGVVIVLIICALVAWARWKSHLIYLTTVIEVRPAQSGMASSDAVLDGAGLAMSNSVIASALRAPGVPHPTSIWGQSSPLTRLKQRLRVSAALDESTITLLLETNSDDVGEDTVLLGAVVQSFLSEIASRPDLSARLVQPPTIR
jgi:hypothetical protein